MPAALQILSDFDGVWTDQAPEARFVRRAFCEALAGYSGGRLEELEQRFALDVARLRGRPAEHGWAPDGRVTAFVDEDLLLETSSWAAWVDADPARGPEGLAEGLAAAGLGSVGELAGRVFLEATRRFETEGSRGLAPGAAEALEGLLATGARVVVASNSEPAKLERAFGGIGADWRGGAPRLAGGAKKYVLGDEEPRTRDFGGRRVSVDRPHYEALLLRERPDVVVGDVFSLDLALPYVLREDSVKSGFRPLLVLKMHPHTPDWTLSLARSGVIDHVVSDLGELVALVQNLSPRTPTETP